MFRFNQQLGTSVQSISPEALERLQTHPWHGNIRELQSVLREALIVSTGPTLLPSFCLWIIGQMSAKNLRPLRVLLRPQRRMAGAATVRRTDTEKAVKVMLIDE